MTDQLKTFLCGLLYSLVDLRKFGHDGGHRVSYSLGQITAAERLGVLTYGQAERFRDLLINAGKHASHPFPCDENSGPCMPIGVWFERHKAEIESKPASAKAKPPVRAPEPEPRPSWLDGGLEALEMVKEDMTAAEPVALEPESKSKEGWGWPFRAKSGHYFVGGQSICGRWLYTGPVYAKDYGSLRHCSACRGKLAVKPQAQVLANEPEQVPAPAPSRDLRLLCLLVPSRAGGTRSLPVHTLRPVPPRVCDQGRWNLASETGFHLRETQAAAPAPEVLERYSRLGQANAFRAHP